MEWIGVIGIVVGLVLFVIAAMKGWNVLITSIVTAVIIVLTNGMDIMDSMVGAEKSYVTGLAGFIRGNLLIFMGGAIMGEFMDKSGAAKSIAQFTMKKVGTKRPYFILLGIAAVGALLTYAGISMFVAMFALIPLARPMFRECNMPWHLFCAAWSLAACSFTMAMIPGVPAIAWINAANGCGVSLTAAPIMGIVGSIIAIVVSCLYIKFALKRAEAKGEHYVESADDVAVEEDKNIPNLGLSLLPLILLIVTIIGLSATGMKNVVYIGMVVGILASMLCFFKFVPISLTGSIFAIVTYIFGALIVYYGFEQSFAYFSAQGMDATLAANAAVTNPGVSLVLASGGIGLAIICLSQMKVETSNSIGGANAVSNLFDSLFGKKLAWPVAVIIANAIGLAFILGNILDQVNAFMSYGSILTSSWCILLITDYYIVRGKMGIGAREIDVSAQERTVNWRGVGTLVAVSVVASVLYATGILQIPFLLVAPASMVIYILVSWLLRDKVRSGKVA